LFKKERQRGRKVRSTQIRKMKGPEDFRRKPLRGVTSKIKEKYESGS